MDSIFLSPTNLSFTYLQLGDCTFPGMRSLLLVGPPGAGKTTLLRDITRIMADTFGRSVAVVDTSNEIASDFVVPHECIGSARRFMVPDRRRQHEVLIEVRRGTDEAII